MPYNDGREVKSEVIDLVSSSDENENGDEHKHEHETRRASKRARTSQEKEIIIIDDDDDDDDDCNSKNKDNKNKNKRQLDTSVNLFVDTNIHEHEYDHEHVINKKQKRAHTNIHNGTNATLELTVTLSAQENTKSYKIYREDGDDGILTMGLSHLIENLASAPAANPNHTSASKSTIVTYLNTQKTQHRTSTAYNSNHKSTCRRRGHHRQENHIPKPNKELVHIQQRDKWSCGFRNLQMLLSGILPNVPNHHPIHAKLHSCQIWNEDQNQKQQHESKKETCITTIPSIRQIQSIIEKSWSEGFDSEGSKHFKNQIISKKGSGSKIGAVEISSILSYLYVDNTVIQFITCSESRCVLSSFIWSYFNKEPFSSFGFESGSAGYEYAHEYGHEHESGLSSCYYCKGESISSSLDSSYEILQFASSSTCVSTSSTSTLALPSTSASISAITSATELIHSNDHTVADMNNDIDDSNQHCHLSTSTNRCTQGACCNHPLLPIYLQWEGHSVSCIGIERIPSNQISPNNAYGNFNSNNSSNCNSNNNNNNNNKNTKRKNRHAYSYNLLIFDPEKSGSNLKKNLNPSSISKTSTTAASPFTRVQSSHLSNKHTPSKNVLRLSTNELLRKDCQIVLSSLKPLNDNIRQTRAAVTHSNVITAAHDIVEKKIREESERRNQKLMQKQKMKQNPWYS